MLVTDGCGISSEIALKWTSLEFSDVDLDPCRHMASLSHNELTRKVPSHDVIIDTSREMRHGTADTALGNTY